MAKGAKGHGATSQRETSKPEVEQLGTKSSSGEHVPESAENFEHALRRLVRQKEKKRTMSRGDYL